jgi:hypothetical protein
MNGMETKLFWIDLISLSLLFRQNFVLDIFEKNCHQRANNMQGKWQYSPASIIVATPEVDLVLISPGSEEAQVAGAQVKLRCLHSTVPVPSQRLCEDG